MEPGPYGDRQAIYRRRILLTPGPDVMRAEMEDFHHHLRITFAHGEGVVGKVGIEIVRLPWSECPIGAQAVRRLEGTRLDDAVHPHTWTGDRSEHCVHELDLAHLAIVHARDTAPLRYDAVVRPPGDARKQAWLYRDGEIVLHWTIEAGSSRDRTTLALIDSGPMTGLTVGGGALLAWAAKHLDARGQEEVAVLRRACHISHGNFIDLDAQEAAGSLREGDNSCYSYRKEIAAVSWRVKVPDRPLFAGPLPPE